VADCCSPTFLFVLIRTVHYATCLLFLSIWAFKLLALPAVVRAMPDSIRKRWETLESRWLLLLVPLIAISGIAWFAILCVNMSGLPFREAMHADTIRTVWSQTSFGRLWRLRLVLWIATGAMPVGSVSMRMPAVLRRLAIWVNFLLAAALVGSLAWAGHGPDGGAWHLLADATHLCVAGLWPMGLAPFSVLLFELRKLPSGRRRPLIAAITRRFSLLSLCSVALLTFTGFVNGLFLIASWSDLIRTGYGRLLLLKLTLFLSMILIGAVNLLRLKPRLTNPTSEEMPEASSAKLQRNVWGEFGIGLCVLVITAILGLLSPSG
jgi:putative copper resistance protein D